VHPSEAAVTTCAGRSTSAPERALGGVQARAGRRDAAYREKDFMVDYDVGYYQTYNPEAGPPLLCGRWVPDSNHATLWK